MTKQELNDLSDVACDCADNSDDSTVTALYRAMADAASALARTL